MPRKYRRTPGTRKYHDFSEEIVQKAIDRVKKHGMSIREAAEMFGVPKSTLQRRVSGKNTGSYGRPRILSEDDETALTDGIIAASKWGFPLTTFDIRPLVKSYLDKKGVREKRFKNNLPGKDWISSYLARHKDALSLRLSENIKRSRSQITPELIDNYFIELEESLEGVSPEAIVNFDETNLTDDPGRVKVVVRRGSKHTENILDTSKASTSVMFAGSASGVMLPPYVVYKAEHLYNTWMEGGPRGTQYNRSKSGWFDGTIFEDWFCTIALPYLKSLGNVPKVLIADNLASHVSVSVIKQCQENNIRFVLIPPHSTHLCQPLDVAFFRPLKMKWREALRQWKEKHRGCIPKQEFPRLLKHTIDSLADSTESNLVAGFRACGIWPIDKNAVLKKLPRQSDVLMESVSPEAARGSNAWVPTFEEFLNKKRSSETHTGTTKRKTRVNVTPGKSVCISILEDRNEPGPSRSAPPSTLNENKKGRKQVLCANESEDDSEMQNSSSSDDEDASTTSCVQDSLSQSANVKELKDVTEGDFVLANLIYDEGRKKEQVKQFVCKILSVFDEDRYLCRFMRNYRGSTNTFVFPVIDDVSEIPFKNLCKIVVTRSIFRDRYTFQI